MTRCKKCKKKLDEFDERIGKSLTDGLCDKCFYKKLNDDGKEIDRQTRDIKRLLKKYR